GLGELGLDGGRADYGQPEHSAQLRGAAPMARLQTRRGRPAAALVETAAVVIVFLLFLFGIFEYCRLIYVQQMVENAAREGARYAIVNTTDTNLIADTQAQVNAKMS